MRKTDAKGHDPNWARRAQNLQARTIWTELEMSHIEKTDKSNGYRERKTNSKPDYTTI